MAALASLGSSEPSGKPPKRGTEFPSCAVFEFLDSLLEMSPMILTGRDDLPAKVRRVAGITAKSNQRRKRVCPRH